MLPVSAAWKEEAEDASAGPGTVSPSPATWICPRCKKRFDVEPTTALCEEAAGTSMRSDRLPPLPSRVQTEHEDWHFAMDLNEETVGGGSEKKKPKRTDLGARDGSHRKGSGGGGGLGGWLVRKPA